MIKEIKVDDKEYKLQKLPVRPALELRQRARDGADINDIKFYEELLEHILIEPKLGLDDFEDIGHMERLMLEIIEFQYQGK